MAQCKGCGKEMVWGITGTGKKIPLDPGPAIYRVVELNGVAKNEGEAFVERIPGAMVSHFATCPKAADFSGSKKKGGV